jgi:hypothetical protein
VVPSAIVPNESDSTGTSVFVGRCLYRVALLLCVYSCLMIVVVCIRLTLFQFFIIKKFFFNFFLFFFNKWNFIRIQNKFWITKQDANTFEKHTSAARQHDYSQTAKNSTTTQKKDHQIYQRLWWTSYTTSGVYRRCIFFSVYHTTSRLRIFYNNQYHDTTNTFRLRRLHRRSTFPNQLSVCKTKISFVV